MNTFTTFLVFKSYLSISRCSLAWRPILFCSLFLVFLSFWVHAAWSFTHSSTTGSLLDVIEIAVNSFIKDLKSWIHLSNVWVLIYFILNVFCRKRRYVQIINIEVCSSLPKLHKRVDHQFHDEVSFLVDFSRY